jgi:hypothetical protein
MPDADLTETLIPIYNNEAMLRRRQIGFTRECSALLPAGEPGAFHVPLTKDRSSAALRDACGRPTTYVRLVAHPDNLTRTWRSVCDEHANGSLA